MCHSVPRCAVVCHCVLQCAAVCHTVLQCSAVRCHRVPLKDQGVLQCESEALPLCCSALLTVLQCVVDCVAVRCALCCGALCAVLQWVFADEWRNDMS